MDKCRNNEYDKVTFNKNNDEVVKMLAMPQTQASTSKPVEKNVVKNPKKKRSALEISNYIGVYGAFGRTLSDLHKQGR